MSRKQRRPTSLMVRSPNISACTSSETKSSQWNEATARPSGEDLVAGLCHYWNYRVAQQVGSHVLLETETPGHQRFSSPRTRILPSERSVVSFALSQNIRRFARHNLGFDQATARVLALPQYFGRPRGLFMRPPVAMRLSRSLA